jgi:tRNA (guanine-N7-)-methyltransferase
MRPGAELRFATDAGSYARTALLNAARSGAFQWVAASPADWRERPPDWSQTRYEAKAVRDGRISYYLRFIRIR